MWLGWAAHGVAWGSDVWDSAQPGGRHLTRTTRDPWHVEALVVDPCASGIELRTTKSVERGRTASSFGQSVGALAAVNGDFFEAGFTPSGLAVGGGLRWSDTADGTGNGFIGFGNGRAEVAPDQELRVAEP